MERKLNGFLVCGVRTVGRVMEQSAKHLGALSGAWRRKQREDAPKPREVCTNPILQLLLTLRKNDPTHSGNIGRTNVSAAGTLYETSVRD